MTDTDNKAVKIISAGGQQISKLAADFSCPVGVAVDSNDNIIVSDWKDKISVSCCIRFEAKLCFSGTLFRPWTFSLMLTNFHFFIN